MENFHFIIQENFIEGADNFATKSEGISAAVAEKAEDRDRMLELTHTLADF